jgi:hypothetical protein
VRGENGLELGPSREHSDDYCAPTKCDSLRRRLPQRSLEGRSGLFRCYPLGGVDQGCDHRGLKPTVGLIDVASNLTGRITELGTPATENPRLFDLPCNGDEDGPAGMRAAADSGGLDSVTGADASCHNCMTVTPSRGGGRPADGTESAPLDDLDPVVIREPVACGRPTRFHNRSQRRRARCSAPLIMRGGASNASRSASNETRRSCSCPAQLGKRLSSTLWMTVSPRRSYRPQ